METQAGHDDITSFKTWVKFLPDSEAQEKERLSPEIPVVCPTPVKGASSVIINAVFLPVFRSSCYQLELVLNYHCTVYLFNAIHHLSILGKVRTGMAHYVCNA